jgi:lysophospholipase L1-like esterase
MINLNNVLFITLLNMFSYSLIAQSNLNEQDKPIRYVPLGDSYTICQGAKLSECWTELLTVNLYKKSVKIELITNPARSGWTTKDLIERELGVFELAKPDFTTLLIGVNDWVQNVPEDTFRRNFSFIIDRIQGILPDSHNIVIITIPDFSVKPKGQNYSEGRNISAGLMRFNEIIFEEAAKRKIRTVDLFTLSQEMKYDKEMIAADGLHPSYKEYEIWEKMIFPAAYEILKKQ